MHLLSALCAGIAAAANGHAEIYIRGTNTRATVYGDFEASTSDSSGADIDLDAYGSALVYVNQLVDVRVYDEDDVLVRDYGDGYGAKNVEVISPAFTGTDYVSTLSAVSEPTTVEAVLDLWVTNAGAPDWKVLIGGTNTTLVNAFGTLTGLVFNVKSPQFGATGNGVTNDQAAIQAALAAAVAAGGGVVYFPAGNYLISTAIEWSHLVSIQGAGPYLSVITTNSGSNARIITWTTSGPGNLVTVSGLGFQSSQANSGAQLYATVALNLLVDSCLFGASSTATGQGITLATGTSQLRVRDTLFQCNGASGTAASWTNTSTTGFIGCTFKTTGTVFNGSLVTAAGARDVFTDCRFDIVSLLPGSLVYGLEGTYASGSITAEGCHFVPAGGLGYLACLKFTAGSVATVSGCDMSGTRYAVTGMLSSKSSLQLGTTRVESASTAFTISDGVGLAEYKLSGTVPTFTMPTMLYPGQPLVVYVLNSSGGNWIPVFTGSVGYASVPTATGGGTGEVCQFRVSDLSAAGTYVWALEASTA